MKPEDQWQLIDYFGQMAVLHPKIDISSLYNQLMAQISDEDVPFVSNHYALLLTAAKSAREAPDDIRKKIAAGR